MSYHLSILDQSPVYPNETAENALHHTVQLAKIAEKLGYRRFWVSEHHNMSAVASSAPEILIAHLLAHTSTIQIGSGGVMLQHYSPYKVSEVFQTLEALHPDRVNLGIGKAPGGLDLSTKALQYGTMNDRSDFIERLQSVQNLLNKTVPKGDTLEHIRVYPDPQTRPDIFLLGTSEISATLAREYDIDFVYAHFLNNDERSLEKSLQAFQAKQNKRSFILAISVIAADTKEEAERLAQEHKIYEITYESGRTTLVQSLEQVERLAYETDESYTYIEKDMRMIADRAEHIHAKLKCWKEKYNISEFMIHTPIQNRQARIDSFKKLSTKSY